MNRCAVGAFEARRLVRTEACYIANQAELDGYRQTAINRALLLEKEKSDMYFVVDYAELLKGDIKSRYEAYRIGLEANFLQPDEVRYMEDLKPLGLEFIKLGLNDVLYDTKTKEFYTPNTNQHAKMGEKPLQNAEKDDTIQNRDYIQDPETGLMMGSTPEGGEDLSDGASGDSEENSKSKPRKIGTVDFKDKDAVTAVIRDFESRYAEADIEHCIVVTTQGEVYELGGGKWIVNPDELGDKMKGSINSHNHVTGESSYSFSREDLESSVDDGSYRVEGFNEKYRCSIVIDRIISSETLYNAYKEAELEVDEVMMLDWNAGIMTIPDEDIQHEVVKRTCEKVGIKYEREKKNELYQEYLEKGRAICRKYQEAAEVVRKKNKVNGHIIRDASVREENALRKKKYEELKKIAEVYRAKCNE